jgi:hypothetical protein
MVLISFADENDADEMIAVDFDDIDHAVHFLHVLFSLVIVLFQSHSLILDQFLSYLYH